MYKRLLIVFVNLLVVAFTTSFAQDKYPANSIILDVPEQLGSSDDVVGRVLARHLERELGKRVTVENFTSNDPGIGADAVAKAPAGGYTLLLGSSTTQVFNFVTSAKFPYNPLTDFTPIARVVEDRVVLLVGERLPVKNMGEFLELCKKPGVNISYGNISENGFSGFSGEILNHACGGALKEVAFDRRVPALAALGNGRIDALFTTLRTAISLSEKYSAKLIGVADEHPLAGYDEKISIPKYITGFSLTSWQGLFGPANLPEAITKNPKRESRVI